MPDYMNAIMVKGVAHRQDVRRAWIPALLYGRVYQENRICGRRETVRHPGGRGRSAPTEQDSCFSCRRRVVHDACAPCVARSRCLSRDDVTIHRFVSNKEKRMI